MCFMKIELVFSRNHSKRNDRGVATGYIGIYILPISVQVNFSWGNPGKNDVRTAIKHEYYVLYLPEKNYTPKQISGYAPA